MCDVSYDWETISRRTVTSRRKRTCCGCDRTWPAGTRMDRIAGKWEGDMVTSWGCPVCVFATADQRHETPELHYCWHDPIEWPDENREYLYEYIKATLAKGEDPTVAGAEAARAAAMVEEEA